MDHYDITFRSVTAAMQGERVLREAGIPNALLRTPQKLRQNGCGYSLRLAGRFYPAAVQELRARGAPFQRVFRHLPDGQWEEVAV